MNLQKSYPIHKALNHLKVHHPYLIILLTIQKFLVDYPNHSLIIIAYTIYIHCILNFSHHLNILTFLNLPSLTNFNYLVSNCV
jgi:hypothetical protein